MLRRWLVSLHKLAWLCACSFVAGGKLYLTATLRGINDQCNRTFSNLPQAIVAVIPVLANMVIAMFKETALLSSITIMELLAQGKNNLDAWWIALLNLLLPVFAVVAVLLPRLFGAF